MRYVSSIERLAMEEGMEQGLQKGVQQGQAKALLRQMTSRFGILPTWVQQRIASATDTDLDGWLEAILNAESIEDMFGSGPRH